MNERVDYIKDNVQLGVWSVSDGYIVAKKFLSERDNNKLVENQTLEKQRERYLRNMVSKYNSGKKVMRRTNFAIMGVSQSGKNALAENWAKMKVDKGDDYFVSTPDMDGLAKDPFGRYNGQRVSVFNEFTEMPAPAFKNAFDKDTQTDYYLTDNLSQENYRQKYKFLFTFDYRSSKISKESQLNGVLDMKHVRPFDPINPYRYEDYVQGGVTKDDFKKISQKVYDKRMADYGFVNRMLFDEIVDKIEQMY